MLNSLQQRYNEIAVRILGYTVAVHFEEFVLLLAGIFIGGIIGYSRNTFHYENTLCR